MYWFILLRIITNQYVLVHTSTDKYIVAYTSIYQYIPVYHTKYWYVLVCSSTYQQFLDSKKLQTRFDPVIFCILFVYFTAALRVHSEQIPGICQLNCLCT